MGVCKSSLDSWGGCWEPRSERLEREAYEERCAAREALAVPISFDIKFALPANIQANMLVTLLQRYLSKLPTPGRFDKRRLQIKVDGVELCVLYAGNYHDEAKLATLRTALLAASQGKVALSFTVTHEVIPNV